MARASFRKHCFRMLRPTTQNRAQTSARHRSPLPCTNLETDSTFTQLAPRNIYVYVQTYAGRSKTVFADRSGVGDYIGCSITLACICRASSRRGLLPPPADTLRWHETQKRSVQTDGRDNEHTARYGARLPIQKNVYIERWGLGGWHEAQQLYQRAAISLHGRAT